LAHAAYDVKVTKRDSEPVLAFINGTTSYQFVFNPSWVQATGGSGGKHGLLVRTQDCDCDVGGMCVFCGGSAEKASILTFAELQSDGFLHVDDSSVVFGPYDESDAWGTEDPRIQYNPKDETYYMFYTAYNGEDILLSLATTRNPSAADGWTRLGAVFPSEQGSKSGALLLREEGPHYLLWGDHDIRIAASSDLTSWPSTGDIILSTRDNHFDSQLVESGPPPLPLSNGDYLFFYNSAELGWPDDPATAYHPGWVILSGSDPTQIVARSEEPLMGPKYAWETGEAPYTCNVPNVVFLEAARPLGNDRFEIFFGAADAAIGRAVVEVTF
ncbi:unnamed protein product, partial [Ectocarpus fasciculatus]